MQCLQRLENEHEMLVLPGCTLSLAAWAMSSTSSAALYAAVWPVPDYTNLKVLHDPDGRFELPPHSFEMYRDAELAPEPTAAAAPCIPCAASVVV